MHNHNSSDSGGGHKGMMWGMILCCALLLGVLFLGGSSFLSGGYVWPILIGVFVVAHVWMMFRGHGHTNTENKTDDASAKESGAKDGHKHSGSCH